MHDDDPVLTAADRCDSCGARAYARVTIRPGQELLFCGHHWHQRRDVLKARYPIWLDETHRIRANEEKPTQ